MKVSHCGFEMFVPKHDLYVAHKGPTVQGVGRESVTQIVRCEALQVAASGSLSYGPLDVGFMTTPSHLSAAAGISARCF